MKSGADERIISGASRDSDEEKMDAALRPERFSDFVGQDSIKENLSIFVEAAKHRSEALDHVLFCGPPGLGKTTLSRILASELGVGIHTTSGPVLEKKGDLAGNLTNLAEKDILFIDEIHRLNRVVEETLYPAMEDFVFDIMIGEGPLHVLSGSTSSHSPLLVLLPEPECSLHRCMPGSVMFAGSAIMNLSSCRRLY